MKIIVFGASGHTGNEIVTQALAQGHSVTAFVRDPQSLAHVRELRIVQGDVLDRDAVADAVPDHRAVLSALGARTLKKSSVLAQGMPHILDAMRQNYVSRLIVLGAAGVDPGAGKYQNALTNIVLWTIRKTVLRHPFADQAAQERLLAQSEIDYTIVRAPRLIEGPVTRNYRVLPDALPSGATHISYADAAHFMLQQLTDPRFHRQGPYIGD